MENGDVPKIPIWVYPPFPSLWGGWWLMNETPIDNRSFRKKSRWFRWNDPQKPVTGKELYKQVPVPLRFPSLK